MPRIALIAIVALVAAASPAAAAPQLVTRTSGNVALGPALAGERLFYGELGRSAMALRIATIGAGTRRLDTVSRPGSSSENEVSPGDYSIVSSSLAASPERLAFVQLSSAGNARYQQGQNSIRQLGGTPTGRLSTLAQCGNQSYYGPGSSTVDVDGTRTAATDCAGRIVIHDHDAVVATVEAGPGLAVGTLALAGRYVAYNAYAVPPFTTPTATVVHDWTTNSKVYEVPRATSFDLQADGTLAVATVPDATCERSKLAWYSIAEPVEHVLPHKPCHERIRLTNNNIATILYESGPRRVLALTTLDGQRTDVARLGTPKMLHGAPDYDGTSVAYALRNCAQGTDLLTAPTANPELRDEPRKCPVALPTRRATLGPTDRTALVAIDCIRGCAGSLAVTATLNGRRTTIGTRGVRIGPEDCPARIARVPIARAARTHLRRRGHLNAHVTARTRDREGSLRQITRPLRLRAAREDRAVEPQEECAL